MTKIIAVANQKGGVGKTTTAISLAGAFVHFGKTCLLIDMDPQGNCGRGVGIDSTTLKNTIMDILVGNGDINKIIRKTQTPNIDLLPANLKLAMIESMMPGNLKDLLAGFILTSFSAMRIFSAIAFFSKFSSV